MKNQFRERLSFCATMIEMVVGGLILIGCIISGIGLIGTTDISELLGDAHYLQDRMSDACLILIGAEMLKMITSYTIDSVVDVMLLAIARQMIVEHTSPQENLLAVLSVGVLFVIRKFLYISRLDKRRELERKKKEDKQKGSAPSPAAENAEAPDVEPLQSDEMRKRDEFHIDEELEELERLKAAVERKAEEELRHIEQMEKNVIHWKLPRGCCLFAATPHIKLRRFAEILCALTLLRFHGNTSALPQTAPCQNAKFARKSLLFNYAVLPYVKTPCMD